MREPRASDPDFARALVSGAATTVDQPGNRQGEPQLLVLEAGGLAVYQLPSSGTLSIGRAEECQVRLRDPLASRLHATLHIQPLAIEDNGSANGTLLGERRLEPGVVTPMRPEQTVSLGNSLLLVKRAETVDAPLASPSAPRLVAVRPHVIIQPAMKQVYALVDQLARGSINILILGETGVGKEIVAEAVHRASPRSGAELVRINCAALSEQLLETELFGHERGAFTGAVSAKPGLIEAANGGTVFLDEAGDLPATVQAKLLRVLEAREVTRVGSVHARRIDVRFISATNKNLDTDVARGTFRSDLLYRLNGASIQVPPLRERPLEILPFAELFILRVAGQLKLSRPPRLSDSARASLLAHDWPGNVRELRNVIERATLICSGPTIEAQDLALQERSALASAGSARPGASLTILPLDGSGESSAPAPLSTMDPSGQARDDSFDTSTSERERILNALLQCGGNQSRAAAFLGIPRRTLVRKIAQLGLPRPRGASD